MWSFQTTLYHALQNTTAGENHIVQIIFDQLVSGSAPAFALALALAFDEATEALGKAFAFGKGIDFALDSIVKENWDLAPGVQLNMRYFPRY